MARQPAPLERIGLVTRESNPTDARLALVVLTPLALGRLWSREEKDELAGLPRQASPDRTRATG